MHEKYKNQKVCEDVKCLPKGTLRKAKKLGAPGLPDSGLVYWELVEPWLRGNQQLLTEEDGEHTITELKAKSLKLDLSLKELELKKAEERMVERAYVCKYLKTISTMQKNMFIQKLRNELPAVLVGKSETEITTAMETVVQELCEVMEKLRI